MEGLYKTLPFSLYVNPSIVYLFAPTMLVSHLINDMTICTEPFFTCYCLYRIYFAFELLFTILIHNFTQVFHKSFCKIHNQCLNKTVRLKFYISFSSVLYIYYYCLFGLGLESNKVDVKDFNCGYSEVIFIPSGVY